MIIKHSHITKQHERMLNDEDFERVYSLISERDKQVAKEMILDGRGHEFSDHFINLNKPAVDLYNKLTGADLPYDSFGLIKYFRSSSYGDLWILI